MSEATNIPTTSGPSTRMPTYWIEVNVSAHDALPIWRDMIGKSGQRLRWGAEATARAAFAKEAPKEVRLMCARDGVSRQVLPAPLLDANGAPE
jgi:hypothetical protein